MVDKDRRKKLAFHLRQLAVGNITNDDFENSIIDDVSFGSLPEHYHSTKKAKLDDAIIQPMLELCWNLYSDLETHKLEDKYKLSKDQLKEIAKYILFLQSDYEYQWKDISFINPIFYFSFKDFWLTIISLGQHYKDIIDEQKATFHFINKDGHLEYWPFFTREQFQNELKNPPFLTGN